MNKKNKNSVSLKKRFIHRILHDLRTPLTVLKGEIELALKKSRPLPEYKTVLISNLEEVDRISLIVENLSLLMRFEAGDVNFQKKPVNVNRIIENIIDNKKALTGQKEVRISFRPEREMIVAGDEGHLSIFFTNMLNAAAEYVSGECRIFLSLNKKNSSGIIRITGLDMNKSAGRLHPFSGENFGLSLKVSKYIIEAHNGKFRPEKELSGSTAVVISLPLS